jgi:hypothetical protein
MMPIVARDFSCLARRDDDGYHRYCEPSHASMKDAVERSRIAEPDAAKREKRPEKVPLFATGCAISTRPSPTFLYVLSLLS